MPFRYVDAECTYLNDAKAEVVQASFHMFLPVARRPDTAHVAPAPVVMDGGSCL